MPDDVTNGELARRIDRLEATGDRQFAALHHEIRSLQFVSRDAFDALEHRVDVVEESNRWKFRFLAGALMALTVAVVSVVLTLVAQ